MIPRTATDEAALLLETFRAVVIQGARQVGKSTLAHQLASHAHARIVSFDDEQELSAALADANLYLENLGQPAVIDEIQRAGQSFVLALKRRLDARQSAGQYVLTGSSDFLTTPALSESLAGRIGLLTLWPLSMAEITSSTSGFIDRALKGDKSLTDHNAPTPTRDEYLDMLTRGGYPEVQNLSQPARERWHEAYLDTVLRREIQFMADIRRFDALHRLARVLLSSGGSELVVSHLGDKLGLDRITVENYYVWLETAFLVHRIPAWSRNQLSKLTKRPKTYALDTGLATSLMGKNAQQLRSPTDTAVGGLVENFAINELAKTISLAQPRIRMFHYRDTAKNEVDAILETADGSVIAIEIKASTLARPDDAAPMAKLRDSLDRVGDDFRVGVVFHTGDRRIVLGDRIVGIPLSDIWT